MSSQRTFLLGLFFMMAIGVLGYYTLFMTDFNLFTDQPEMVVHFPEAKGLREGDGVLVAGMRWGRVKTLTYTGDAAPDQRITATLVLEREIELREGAEIRIQDATLLGGRHVYIEPGAPGAPLLPRDAPFYGRVQPNPIESIGSLFDGEGASLGGVLENIDGLITEVRTGEGIASALVNDSTMREQFTSTLTNVESASAKLDDIATRLTQTDGTVGALINSREIYEELLGIGDRFEKLFDDLSTIGESLRGKDGLLGRLLNETEMADDASAAVKGLREIVEDLRAGKGSIGQFLTQDELADNLNALLEGLTSEEGTIGALMKDRGLYDKLTAVMDDAARISKAIAESEGTLGKLIMDDDLYTEITRAVRLMTRSLEEFREAAPITTFTSVLFGAF